MKLQSSTVWLIGKLVISLATAGEPVFRSQEAELTAQDYLKRYLSYHGSGPERNDANARENLRKAAELGNADAQCTLGHYFEFPFDWDRSSIAYPLSNNVPEAIRWYRRAVEQEHAGARRHLAMCYLHGVGVEKSEERGLALMRLAADQGNSLAQMKLAELYARGIGEPHTENERPIELLRKAADRLEQDETGFPVAGAISFRYQTGLGTDRDVVDASRWYCRAAAVYAGLYPLNSKQLRSMNPDATPFFLETLATYIRAASGKDIHAFGTIGNMYLEGREVPRSAIRAWAWFTLGKEKGDYEVAPKIAIAEARLRREEAAKKDTALFELRAELDRFARTSRSAESR